MSTTLPALSRSTGEPVHRDRRDRDHACGRGEQDGGVDVEREERADEGAEEHRGDGEPAATDLRAGPARELRVRADPVSVIVSTVVVSSGTASRRTVAFWIPIAIASSAIRTKRAVRGTGSPPTIATTRRQ
jgi:hypothetical protein